MANDDLNDTQPMPMEPTGQEPVADASKRKRSPWLKISLLGLFVLIVVLAISAFAGYRSGITQRQNAETDLVSFKASEQFELAIQDIESGQFSRAKQRLEYVAQIEPEYPGLTERLAEVLAKVNTTPTPIPEPTATPAPIRDTSDLDKLFAQAQQAFLDKDWTNSIDTLLIIRKNDPTYRAVAIDGILYLALRNRGMDKIAKQADLEGGMYDLSLASKFGPLDYEAQGFMTWTSMYITGASFWELDWVKVIEYFSQLASALPGLSDRSGMTSVERYRLALKGYGLLLLNQGDPCGAAEQLQLSIGVGPDGDVDQALTEAINQCEQGTSNESEPSVEPTDETPIPTIPVIDTPLPPPQDTPTPPPAYP